MMQCSDVLARLTPYADGELSDNDLAGVRRHLAACEECARVAQMVGVLQDRLQESLRESVDCPDLTETIMSRLGVRNRKRGWKWAWACAAAVCLVVAVVVGIHLRAAGPTVARQRVVRKAPVRDVAPGPIKEQPRQEVVQQPKPDTLEASSRDERTVVERRRRPVKRIHKPPQIEKPPAQVQKQPARPTETVAREQDAGPEAVVDVHDAMASSTSGNGIGIVVELASGRITFAQSEGHSNPPPDADNRHVARNEITPVVKMPGVLM